MTVLPDGWALTPLSEVCETVQKVVPATIFDSEFRYLDIGSIDGSNQTVIGADFVDVEAAPSRARQLLERGDTAFSTVVPI